MDRMTVWLLFGALACASAVAQGPTEGIASRVQALVTRGDLAGARAELEAAATRGQRDATFYNLVGIVEAQAGNYRAAESAFEAVIRLAPHAAPAYENLGRLYQEHAFEDSQAGRKAIETYRGLLRIQPASPEGNFQLARLLALEGAYAESRSHLLKLAAEAQERPGALAVLCLDYAGGRDSERARDGAARLLKHPALAEGDVVSILPLLGRIGAPAIAKTLLEGLAGRGLASPATLEGLAGMYEAGSELSKARDTLEAAARGGGATVPRLLGLARIAYKQRDFEGALGYLAHARDIEPRNAGILFFFGIASIELHLPIEAEKSLDRAVELDPSNPFYHYAAGGVKLELEKYDAALSHFRAYSRAKPGDPRGPLMLGVVNFHTYQDELGAKEFGRAARARETAAAAHYYLGRIAARQGDLERASAECGQAIAVNPDYADAHAELGSVLLALNRFPEAERAVRRALELDPDHYRANFNLLTLYLKLRDPRAAAQKTKFDQLREKQFENMKLLLRTIQAKPY